MLTKYIVAIIAQPLWVYGAIALGALAAQIGYLIYRITPRVRRLYRSLTYWSDKNDPYNGIPRNGTNLTQKRKYSTQSPSGGGGSLSTSAVKRSSSKSSLYHSTLLRTNFSLERIQELFTVKGGRPMVNILRGISIMSAARMTTGTIKYIVLFIVTCKNLKRTQGIKGLTKYLKASTVSIQQSLGGHLVRDAGSLGARVSRTRSGLPRCIPTQIRIRIRAGDPTAMRMTLTLFNVYRVFEFPGKLKTSTITSLSTGTGSLTRYLEGLIPLFVRLFVWNRFSKDYLESKLLKWADSSVFPIFKGGPGVQGVLGEWNTDPAILLRSFKSLWRTPNLWESITIFIDRWAYKPIKFAFTVCQQVMDVMPPQVGMSRPRFAIAPLPYLGKLGTKEEAAGKVRVFAMVDGWTQWILYPLHKCLFMILRGVKMDGTFDQTAPLKFVKAVRGLWSLDLSAATDRLPLTIQRELLGALFGYEIAGAWANLLVGRAYRLHDGSSKGYKDLHYVVGQPMGALSSWAMLAFTHHFIVQAAAWRAGFPKWKLFSNYAVLGDDVVIGDYRVTTQYLQIMDSLGVVCGLHKSLLSHKGLAMEFAKKTIVNGVDVSPVAFKEFYAASRNLGAWVELQKKFNIPFHRALDAFGVGWKVRSWLNKPLGKLSARIRLLILAVNVPHTVEEVDQFFKLGEPRLAQYKNDTEAIIEKFTTSEVKRLTSRLMTFSNDVVKHDSNSVSKDWARSALADASGLDFNEFMTLGKGNKPLIHARKLLSDAYSNLLNLYWIKEMHDLVNRSSGLLKEIWNMNRADFPSYYIEFLRISNEINSMSQHTFALKRPDSPEVKGLMTPSQVRIWKRWSQVLQGTKTVAESTAPTSHTRNKGRTFTP